MISHDLREWAKILLPVVVAWLHGWHTPQPPWMNKGDKNG